MQWKVAEMTIPKHVKSPNCIELFETLLLMELKPIIEESKLMPNHKFGLRNKHSTIDQVHVITNIIERTLKDKKIGSVVFLNITQTFDNAWHESLNYIPSFYGY